MAFASDIILTYDDNHKIDDVMEMIIELTPTKTPIFSGIRKEKAKGILHYWKEQSLTTAQDNAVGEGSVHPNPTHDQPTTSDNVCQIFAKAYHVSSSDNWIDQYGFDNQFVKQEMDNLKKIATDVELALLRGSKNTGAQSTARRLGGFLNYISTNVTTVGSGTILTESAFNDHLQTIFDAGGDVDEIYTNSFLKRVISTFVSGSVKEIAAESKRSINTISVYESDFGMQRIFIHRYMPNTSNSDSGILFLNMQNNYIAIGEPIHPLSREEVAQTTQGRKGVIRGELTLAPRAESHQGWMQGFRHAFA